MESGSYGILSMEISGRPWLRLLEREMLDGLPLEYYCRDYKKMNYKKITSVNHPALKELYIKGR